MAEGMLRARAEARGVALDVHSRGLGLDGHPATDEAIESAQARGADIRAHRSAVLEHADVDAADLVLGMERQHAREAIVLEPDALARSFTLKEFVRRAEVVGPRPAGEGLEPWLERLGAGRRAADLLGSDPDDEVADPYRRRLAEYGVCADEISVLVDRLLDLAWPAGRAAGAA